MKALDIIDAYDDLLQKAMRITRYYPEDGARLHHDGDTEAWVTTQNACESYGDCVLENDTSTTFPAALLTASDEEIDAWLEERDKKDEAERAALRALGEQLAEREERRMFEKLKEKYGG